MNSSTKRLIKKYFKEEIKSLLETITHIQNKIDKYNKILEGLDET